MPASHTPSTIPEDRIVDFVDGTLRKKTAEEYVRQNVEKSLVTEYRYVRGDLRIEYSIKLGSRKPRVDIAILKESLPTDQRGICGIIECKKETVSASDKKDGVEQLLSYMAACPNCEFGMWTNGTNERLCFVRVERSGEVRFEPIPDIPAKGISRDDVERPKRELLRPASGHNLLFAMKRCHNYIAGNQGLQKPEAFWELLKIIFTKIEDERSTKLVNFYVTSVENSNSDGKLKVKKRTERLFEKVKKKFSTIFKSSEEIELNSAVCAYVVAELQSYSLLQSTVDVKGVAYEEIVGSNLRGDRGEFFTPRNACRMAVEMLEPRPGEKIIDPAAGTGGFLVTAMNAVLAKHDESKRSIWLDPAKPNEAELFEFYRSRQELMSETLRGLDINPNLVRAAKMNMVMNNDGSGGLTQADSLKPPQTWPEEAQKLVQLNTFDLAFTNPPFGTKIRIDDPDTLIQYELGATWDFDQSTQKWNKRYSSSGSVVLQGSQPPEILFIERVIQLLKPGTGRAAIVIPNGILNNPPLGYVRSWLLSNVQILAVVDMQRDLFQPKNDTQTSMVLVRRFSEKEKMSPKDYPIYFAVTDRIGHDKRGNPIFRRDETGEDLVEEREIEVLTVENGQEVRKMIKESVPIIDDQLAEIPSRYAVWKNANDLE